MPIPAIRPITHRPDRTMSDVDFDAATQGFVDELGGVIDDISAATTAIGVTTAETDASAQRAADSADSAGGFSQQASISAANAATSEANALAFKDAAATSATNAATSETNALASKDAAATSTTNAATSETNALASKDAAATSATNAATSETSALASKDAAAASEANAATSEANALASENAAATWATNAATSEASAQASQNAAATSAANAAAARDVAVQAAADAVAGGIPKSLLIAPGDLIVATAAGTPARLAIGAVGRPLIVGPSGLPDYGQRGPGCYFRDVGFAAPPVAVAADRYCLLSPDRMLVDISGIAAELTARQTLDLSLAATWDNVTTDYRVAANRAGKDFCVYAALVGGVALSLLVSANATYPTGYSAATSRKVAGFHCLCAAVGTISGHPLSGYVAGDILPATVWDLVHRPVSAPEGMTYAAGVGKWADIYFASVLGGELVSVSAAVVAHGGVFDWYDFSELFARIGKRLPTQAEYMALSHGANQATNIVGSAAPATTGGHSDTAGRRMISAVGCEDTCGAFWQWGACTGGPYSTVGDVPQYDASRTNQRGNSRYVPNRVLLGGSWVFAAACGSRCTDWGSAPTILNGSIAVRGISEPLAIGA